MENWLRTLLSQVNIVSIPTASVTAFPTTEEIYIYIGYSAMVAYELLLFSLALWAGIRLSRCPFPENRIGARRLTAILIQGNVTYFLAWVSPPLVYWALIDIDSIWLCLLVYLTVSLTASVGYCLDIRRTKPDNFSRPSTSALRRISCFPCFPLPAVGSSWISEVRSRRCVLARLSHNMIRERETTLS